MLSIDFYLLGSYEHDYVIKTIANDFPIKIIQFEKKKKSLLFYRNCQDRSKLKIQNKLPVQRVTFYCNLVSIFNVENTLFFVF